MTTNPNPNCSRCGDSLARPLPDNANYVTHSDFAELEKVPVYIAQKHTPRTKIRAEALAELLGMSFEQVSANMAHPDAPENVEYTWGRTEAEDGTVTAAVYEHPFKLDAFEEVEVDSPAVLHDDPDIVRIEERVEKREVQKTGLVCRDCLKSDDEILWGPDKEA